jgi:flagellar biosynthesis anti-sigma factor FlgM
MHTGKLNGFQGTHSVVGNHQADAAKERTSEAVQSGAGAHRSADVVRVSGQAAAVARLAERVSALPDVRQDRIDALRPQIEAGTYRPPARAIAEAMIAGDGK